MNKHACILAGKNTGKVDKLLTSLSSAMLSLWALQNTTPNKVSYVFDMVTGEVLTVCTGVKGENFPKVESKPDINIEDILPGILMILAEEEDEEGSEVVDND